MPEPNTGFVAVAGGTSHSLGLKGVFGDLDVDGDIDLDDLSVLSGCLSGPGVLPPLGCARSRLDGDWDVDLADYALLQEQFAGELAPLELSRESGDGLDDVNCHASAPHGPAELDRATRQDPASAPRSGRTWATRRKALGHPPAAGLYLGNCPLDCHI